MSEWTTTDNVPEWVLWTVVAIGLLGLVISGSAWSAPKLKKVLQGKPMLTMILLGVVSGAVAGGFLSVMIWWAQSIQVALCF